MFLRIDTSEFSMQKYYDADLLPDGRKFDFWECKTQFKKTLIVDQNHPNASDEGEGTENAPFKTIGAAAKRVFRVE